MPYGMPPIPDMMPIKTPSRVVATDESGLYEMLGLDVNCTAKDIKSRWRRISMEYHPDRIKGGADEKKEAEEKFGELQQAYEIIKHPFKRHLYDFLGKASRTGLYKNREEWIQDGNPGALGSLYKKVGTRKSSYKHTYM